MWKRLNYMEHNDLTWCPLILGSLNGLFWGYCVEAMRSRYTQYQIEREMQEAVQHGGIAVSMIDIVNPHFIPCLCILLFAGFSVFIHRCFANRFMSLIIVWELIGVMSFIGFLVSIRFTVLFSLYKHELESLWSVAVMFTIVLILNFAYGGVISFVSNKLAKRGVVPR